MSSRRAVGSSELIQHMLNHSGSQATSSLRACWEESLSITVPAPRAALISSGHQPDATACDNGPPLVSLLLGKRQSSISAHRRVLLLVNNCCSYQHTDRLLLVISRNSPASRDITHGEIISGNKPPDPLAVNAGTNAGIIMRPRDRHCLPPRPKDGHNRLPPSKAPSLKP